MRLTRLVVADDIPGRWWIKEPLIDYARSHQIEHGRPPSWWPLTSGLDCPFCIGLWIAGGVALIDEVAGDSRWWRLLTSALALNEAAAHIGSRLGDVADDGALADDEDED